MPAPQGRAGCRGAGRVGDGRLGWIAWTAVVFVLWSAGLSHATWHAQRGAPPSERLAHPLRTLRAPLTDDGDVLRYFAYCNALRGQRHAAYYTRAAAAWRAEDGSRGAHADPDAYGERDGPPLLPYRDFAVEYPPGFFLWALPPALLSGDGDAYRLWFGIWMGLLLSASLVLCLRLDPTERHGLPGAAAAAALALGCVVTHRYDAAVSFLVCLACFATVARRPVIAGAALGLGTATKIVPALAAVVIGLALLRARRFRELAIQAGAALLAGGLVVAVALAAWGPGLLGVLRYHARRPIEIESTWAGLLGVSQLVGAGSLRVVESFGSSNVEGGLEPQLAPLTLPLTCVALAVVYARAWVRFGRAIDGPRPLLAAVAATLAVFMVVGKVFSPQYLVWLIPLGLVASRGRARRLLLAVLGLTQLLYPYLYFWLKTLSPWACVLLLVRNGALLYWAHVVQRDAGMRGVVAPPREARALRDRLALNVAGGRAARTVAAAARGSGR